MLDPLQPSPALLCKLGSIIVHASEWEGVEGHSFDLIAFNALLEDEDVVIWMEAMEKAALVPYRRTRSR